MKTKDQYPVIPITSNLLAFVRGLRLLGFRVGSSEVSIVLQALIVLDPIAPDTVRAALSAVIVQSDEQLALFDKAYSQFLMMLNEEPNAYLRQNTLVANLVARVKRSQRPQVLWAGISSSPSKNNADVPIARGTSAEERLRHLDFAYMTADEQRILSRTMLQVAPRLLRGRRSQTGRHGTYFDLSTTMRRGMVVGEPIRLWRTQRQWRQRPVVILIDVSGSMAPYARMTLQFCHALLQRHFAVEIFVFSTRLTRITSDLRNRRDMHAFMAMAQRVADYGGGTRLTEALHQFRLRWASIVLRPRADFIVATDGYDASPHRYDLAEELLQIRRRVHHLDWWSPGANTPSSERLLGLRHGVHRSYQACTWAQLVSAWSREE